MKNIILPVLLIITFVFNLSAQGYKVGDEATDFKLKNIDGNMVSLAGFPDAKGFIIIFTCNHCPFSVAYEDRIISLDRKYKKLGYPVIAINPNDPELVPADGYKEMQQRSSEKGFTFPYLLDAGQKIYPRYGATRTPHVFLLKREDKSLKVAYIGAIDDNSQEPEAVKEKYLENAVDALLAGISPRPDFTKAIGCTIKTASK
ncbi:MAG: thioredoxin family protein [Bacteroidota bacterium]